MPSAYNLALADSVAQAGVDDGLFSRRDIERRLRSAGKVFQPSYTALQRIADGTRPVRVFELAAIARAFKTDPVDLLPDATKGATAAAVRKATLELTVEQIVGLAHVLGIDEAELVQQVADATHSVATRAAAAQRTKETKRRKKENPDSD